MKVFLTKLAAAMLVVSLLTVTSRAQISGDLETLAKIGSDAVKGWVTPIASGFGNGMNTAFYHSADLHDILGFDIGIKVGIATVQDEDKTYTLNLPATLPITLNYNGLQYGATLVAGVHYPTSVTPQTAVGDETVTSLSLLNGYSAGPITIPAGTKIMDIPGGVNLPVTGAIAPQVAIGLPFGIEVIGRFLPTMDFDGNKIGMTGFGLRYDVDQWLPLFPVDIAVHFATQSLTLKDASDKEVFSAGATAFGVEVSKKLFILTLYGGFQLESSTIKVGDIQYPGPVDAFGNTPMLTLQGFEIEGSNSSRFTVGARMLLLFLNVHAEYSLAKNPMIGLGAGISIR